MLFVTNMCFLAHHIPLIAVPQVLCTYIWRLYTCLFWTFVPVCIWTQKGFSICSLHTHIHTYTHNTHILNPPLQSSFWFCQRCERDSFVDFAYMHPYTSPWSPILPCQRSRSSILFLFSWPTKIYFRFSTLVSYNKPEYLFSCPRLQFLIVPFHFTGLFPSCSL